MMGNRRKPADQRAEMREIKERAARLDRLRQKQVDNQMASLTRLLEDPNHAAEVTELNRQLAELQVALDEALEGAPKATGRLAGAGA